MEDMDPTQATAGIITEDTAVTITTGIVLTGGATIRTTGHTITTRHTSLSAFREYRST